jgi:hypothetical protein
LGLLLRGETSLCWKDTPSWCQFLAIASRRRYDLPRTAFR